MATDGGMAVWSEHKGGCTGATAEVHFNYWRLAGDAAFTPQDGILAKDFIEIGVMLHAPQNVERVQIFLPGQWDVEDCSPRFTLNTAQGIFNKRLEVRFAGPPGPRHIELVGDDGIFCRLHQFPTDGAQISATQLFQETDHGGTFLTILRHALDEVCLNLANDVPAYFRLRAYLKDNQTNPFLETITPTDRRMQSGYTVVDYLDFRLNEARSLPTHVETRMRARPDDVVRNILVAFLTAVPVQCNVTTSSIETHKMRLLEHGLWNDYVPGGIPDGMVVYHWRDVAEPPRNKIEDFSAFVKMESRLTSRRILILYLLIAFAIAIGGNLAASWLYDHLHTPSCPVCSPTVPEKAPLPSALEKAPLPSPAKRVAPPDQNMLKTDKEQK